MEPSIYSQGPILWDILHDWNNSGASQISLCVNALVTKPMTYLEPQKPYGEKRELIPTCCPLISAGMPSHVHRNTQAHGQRYVCLHTHTQMLTNNKCNTEIWSSSFWRKTLHLLCDWLNGVKCLVLHNFKGNLRGWREVSEDSRSYCSFREP